MRKMLLSFKPSVYDKIYAGIKIFEHRRNFPNEPIMAYMYVSKPVRAITGIVMLDNRHKLSDWENDFNTDSDAVARIQEYQKFYRYAMDGFVVPQSYIYLDNNPRLLKYIEERIIRNGLEIKHDFSNITSDQICVC